MEASPASPRILKLAVGESVIDFDVSPFRPEAVLIVQSPASENAPTQQRLVFWDLRNEDAISKLRALEVPSGLSLASVVWHPRGQSLFLLGTHTEGKSKTQEILSTPSDAWSPTRIYRSQASLRRLVAGPRPFEIGYDSKAQKSSTAYRIFFGVRKSDGKYATHSVTERGLREYAVIDQKAGAFKVPEAEVQPDVVLASSGLPSGFHPEGHVLLWQDEDGCFQKAQYGTNNWIIEGPLAPRSSREICKGSLTYAPNGAAYLHWYPGMEGVNVRRDLTDPGVVVAKGLRFVSTPSSVPDGKGLVGVVKEGASLTVQYAPIEVPLADVANAWMFLEGARDRDLFSDHTALFRKLKDDQLFQLYDSEGYACGGYDRSMPTRPYLVTTDIFFELYAAAFEGIFILNERQAAVPRFWTFVEQAHRALSSPGSAKSTSSLMLKQAFAAVLAVRDGTPGNAEAVRIIKAENTAVSSVTHASFDYRDLRPRSHYAADPRMQNYFRASKYLMSLPLNHTELATVAALPESVHQAALAWIGTYHPFLAPSKRPLIWNKPNESFTAPGYIRHPEAQAQVFPLSWGLDNEILFSTSFHASLPEAEQIQGEQGPRILPSGIDVAAILGSRTAESWLETSGEFKRYPSLKAQFAQLKQRFESTKPTANDSLYQRWLAGLATQWSDATSSPADVMGLKFWNRKRLQTGLASWATLRHATVLVNERSMAECGEAGFEAIVLRPPRGYVEPDPATFDAIARLFDATIDVVRQEGKNWSGATPREAYEDSVDGKRAPVQGLRDGVIRRLSESRDKVRYFRDIARKEVDGRPLSSAEYEAILYVGRAAEHNYLIFKSLAQKDFALSQPDPLAKVADVASAGVGGPVLLAGVGQPIEWDQIVPFFGRKIIVKGSAYGYFETVATKVSDDSQWRRDLPSLSRPAWLEAYFSKDLLSCPAKTP